MVCPTVAHSATFNHRHHRRDASGHCHATRGGLPGSPPIPGDDHCLHDSPLAHRGARCLPGNSNFERAEHKLGAEHRSHHGGGNRYASNSVLPPFRITRDSHFDDGDRQLKC